MADQTPEKSRPETPGWTRSSPDWRRRWPTRRPGRAAEAEIEPQSASESARSGSPRGKGRVESAEIAPEAPEVRAENRSDPSPDLRP